MPKCKYCHENITKFDKEICPFCGGKKPLDGVDCSTADITQTIQTVDNQKALNYKPHSKKINAWLCVFFGIFGADNFYLGFRKEGLIRLVINIIYISSLFSLLFFLPTNLGLLYSLLISVGSTFLFYVIIGILSFFTTSKKDSKGIFLK